MFARKTFVIPAAFVTLLVGAVPVQAQSTPVPAAPIGTGPCPGVRPGAIVRFHSYYDHCTLNFLFLGSDGSRYIGTAGHCIEGAGGFYYGEMAWAPGTGPEARDDGGSRIGEFAYAIKSDPKDFSLIRLDPQVQANAGMCWFGGPTAVNADQPTQPVVLNWFGNGVVVGAVLPARSALAAGMPNPDYVFAQGVATIYDSGSGVISSDGRAVGVLVSAGDAVIGISRLTPDVERAQAILGVNLLLQLAPIQ